MLVVELICPLLTALVAMLFAAIIAENAIKALLLGWNRHLRSKNIREKGWPPPHLDADGDWGDEKS